MGADTEFGLTAATTVQQCWLRMDNSGISGVLAFHDGLARPYPKNCQLIFDRCPGRPKIHKKPRKKGPQKKACIAGLSSSPRQELAMLELVSAP